VLSVPPPSFANGVDPIPRSFVILRGLVTVFVEILGRPKPISMNRSAASGCIAGITCA